VRSTQTRGERSSSQEARERQVTVGNELPGRAGQPPAAGEGAGQRENAEKTEEITNFEISRTQRQEVTEAGRLKRVSVAVLVDGVYQRNGAEVAYQPRSQEELDRLTALVRSAIGFDERRGDRVEVVNLRFAEGPPVQALAAEDAPAPMFDLRFSRDDIVRFAEMGVMFVLGLLMLLFVVRPLLRKVLGDAEAGPQGQAALAEAGGGSSPPAIEGGAESPAVKPKIELAESATARAIEVAEIASQMHQHSVQKIGELVSHNPNEAAAIIRSWMNEARQAA
jgi:flagellar M-ring protein FliF